MKFILNIENAYYNKNDKLYVFEDWYDLFDSDDYEKYVFYVNAIILTTKDFDLDSDRIQVTTDTCSVQYRPKALYTDAKGVYYKENRKSKYLTCDEVKELNEFVKMCEEKREDIINKKL